MLFSYQEKLKGKKVGVVFGSFAPLHQGHLDLIMRAKKENDAGCIVIVCGFDGDKGEPKMPHSLRYRYVREFFADDPLVAVYAINDTEIGAGKYPSGWNKWLPEALRIYDLATEKKPKRIWYCGDKNYKDDLEERKEKAILIDRLKDNPISATKIRQNPIKNWDKITFPFKRIFSTNILICGTASEGKTTMTKDLGKYFNAPYSYEAARNYMAESCISDWELREADFRAFLEDQYRLNKSLINSPQNHGIFFADSDSMITRMYAEYYAKDPNFKFTMEEFENIAKIADSITKSCRWDRIYVLCPKGVFVDDHSRYMAHGGMKERKELFEILMKNIEASGNMSKVQILDKGYWKNFETIVRDVKEIIENGKN